MKQKTLIVFATEREASATYKDSLLQHHDILITGIGSRAVENTLAAVVKEYDIIINAGIVGSMHDHIPTGTAVPIRQVFYEKAKSAIDISPSGYCLLTVDAPCYEKNGAFDFVDMEGYMVAHICQHANIPLKFIKIVSDIVSVHSSKHIRERLPELSLMLSKRLSATLSADT